MAIVYLTNADSVLPSGGQADTALVAEVATFLAHWESGDELTSVAAARLVSLVQSRTSVRQPSVELVR